MQLIWNWFRRTFNDPQVVILAVILLFGFVGIAIAWQNYGPDFGGHRHCLSVGGLGLEITTHAGAPISCCADRVHGLSGIFRGRSIGGDALRGTAIS